MESSKILFLNMLKNDIKRSVMAKNGLDSKNLVNDDLLTGQTISESEIKSFSSYKLMNPEEREIIDFILNDMKKKDTGSRTNNKVLTKRIDSLVPRSNEVDVASLSDAA